MPRPSLPGVNCSKAALIFPQPSAIESNTPQATPARMASPINAVSSFCKSQRFAANVRLDLVPQPAARTRRRSKRSPARNADLFNVFNIALAA